MNCVCCLLQFLLCWYYVVLMKPERHQAAEMDSADENIFDFSADLFGDVEEFLEADCDNTTTDSQPLFPVNNTTSAITHDYKPPTHFKDSILSDNQDTLPACNSSSKGSVVQSEDSLQLECSQEGCCKKYLHSSPYHEINGASEEESFSGLPSKRYKICESSDEVLDEGDLVVGGNFGNIGFLNVSDNSLHSLSDDLPGQTAEDSQNADVNAQRHVFQTESSGPSQTMPTNGDSSSVNNLCSNTDPDLQITSTNEDNALIDLNQLSFDKNGTDNQEDSSINPNIADAVIEQKSPPLLPNVSELMCPFCNIQLDTLWLMNNHIETMHAEASNGEAGAVDNTFRFVCPFCDLDLGDHTALNVHLLAAHAEEEQQEHAGATCPLCAVTCHSEDDLRLHIKTHAAEETVYAFSETDQATFLAASSSSPVMTCPVCSLAMIDADLLTSHVESHFNSYHRPGSQNVSSSRQVFSQENVPVDKIPLKQNFTQSSQEKQATPTSSQGGPSTSQNWKPSKSKENISYKQQYEQNLERAVVGGKMTSTDYHEQKLLMAETELLGVDNGSTRTQGLIEKLESLYRNQARAGQVAYLSSPVDYFAGSYGDKGWGCGYRNFQMLLSCLARHPDYARRIFTGENISIPSIPKIQKMIELAWKKGFDPAGCRQLGGRLVNTSKWIGATEIVATLSSLGIKCRLADFHAASASDGTHPRLLEWVNSYFCRRQQGFLPPLYLQHQGHSRTIVGVENERGATKLLLFDPGTPSDQMAALARGQLTWKHMRMFRRTQLGFKARQYQIVAITGLLTDAEYQESKTLTSEQVS